MWFSTSTLDDVDNGDVPVRQLRKPPSQRRPQSAPTQEQSQAATAEPTETANLDPYGWAAIWLLVGYQLYAGAHFKYWVIASIVVVLATDVKYFVGAATLLGLLYFGFQHFFI